MVTSFASDVSRALTEGRELAESLMLDTCTVGTPTGTITNETTGVVTVTYTDVYGPDITPLPGKRAGMCKFKDASARGMTPEAGGATYVVQSPQVHFPAGAFEPAIGMVITGVASDTSSLPVGRRVRVTGEPIGSLTTALRLPVEEVV